MKNRSWRQQSNDMTNLDTSKGQHIHVFSNKDMCLFNM